MAQTHSTTGDPNLRHVDIATASEITGIPVATIRTRMTRGGAPPHYKVGRRVLFNVGELLTWMASHRRTSTADDPPVNRAATAATSNFGHDSTGGQR